MARKLTTSELQAIVSRQITQSESSTAISAERSDLFDQYMGEPYEQDAQIADGMSRVVASDISDTVEWIMPELMEIFTSGDKVVSFEPVGPDDEERAEQETDVVNHVFMRQNDGFLILYSFIKDGLIQKNGYVKRWWDSRETTTVEEYEGLSEDDLLQLMEQWLQEKAEVEVISKEVVEEPQGRAFNIEVRLTKQDECLKVAPVPPEELLIHPRWNSINLKGCPFVAHKKTETASSLIEMGFDRKVIEEIGEAEDEEFSEERIGRFNQDGTEEDSDGEPADASMTEILVHECYVMLDTDGDGVAELRKITTGGSGHRILEMDGKPANEECACVPFSAWTPVIVPHRHFGRSIAELVKDIQRIKTALMRNTLDNFYASNNPVREIAEDGIGENTIEDLLVDRPGKIIRTALPGMYMQHAPTPFAGEALAMIEYVDTVRENRTGVSRLSQGLDANTINKTARGQAQLMTAAQKKIALIARIAAETGVKDLFRGIHDDLRRNATKALTVRLRGDWIAVDPRHWRSRADVAANVALGIGNAEQQMQKLMVIAEKQEQNLLAGSPIVTPANLHHTYEKMIDVAGFKNPGAFFTDPATVEPPQPQPDPQMVQVEGLLAIEQAKAQANAQEAAGRLQLEARKAEMAHQLAAEKAQLEREKAQIEGAKASADAENTRKELAKKIELMNAQIAKIQAEINASRVDVALRAREMDVQNDRAERQFGLEAKRTDGDLSVKERQLKIVADNVKAKAKKVEPKPEPKPEDVKPKRRKITVTRHDDKGRILEVMEEDE